MRIPVGAPDLARARFAVFPLSELDGLLRSLTGLGGAPLPRTWATRLHPLLRRLRAATDLDAVLALQHRAGGAEFTVPPPAGPDQSVDDDLAAVRATPTDVLTAEVADCLRRRPDLPPAVRTVLLAGDAADRVAAALTTAWNALLAPDWPTVRAVCERDITWRADRLTRSGWAHALHGIHSRLSWDTDTITITDGDDRNRPLTADGLLLVPSVFVWPALAVLDTPPWPVALVYPARGSAALRAPTRTLATVDRALGDLLGGARARILTTLDSPSSTTQLARSLHQTTGAVGDHLAVLRRAGLVTGTRNGRSVLYRRTPTGDALTAAPTP